MNIKLINEFKSEFNSELNETPDSHKIIFIENEIKEIDKYIDQNQNLQKKDKKLKWAGLGLKPNHVFKFNINEVYIIFFINAFNDFKLKGKTDRHENISIQETINQAYEFVKYYNWLKELTSEISTNRKQKESKLTLNQKVLALHYLGLDLKNYDKTKSSKVLSQIIGENESNTRKSLSFINSATKEDKVKNKQNLKKLIELFENEQFDTIKTKLKDDLEKVEVTG